MPFAKLLLLLGWQGLSVCPVVPHLAMGRANS